MLSVLCALRSASCRKVFEAGRSGCEHLPLGQGGRAAQLVGLAVNEVAFGREVVGDIGVDRGDLLERLHTPKPLHGSFSSSERQVAVFHPIVGMATDLLLLAVAEIFIAAP